MTLWEAIKIMDQAFPDPPAGMLSARNGKRLHAAGLLAKAAMKRQIPMKPAPGRTARFKRCPCCGALIERGCAIKHCQDCGQALDWGAWQ